MNSLNTPHSPSIKTKEKIGILGGTFDPIHYGHLMPAKQTAHWLGLEQLIFLPAHIPAHKKSTFATTKQRVDMVKLVCDADAIFTLDARETLKNSTSFTVETLIEIKEEHPNSIIYFLMGLDSLLSFHQWHRWQDILSLCHIVVNARPRYDLKSISTETQKLLKIYQEDSLEQVQQKKSGCIIFSPETFHSSSLLDISSTEIRAKLAQSLPFLPELENSIDNTLVPSAVAHYIQQHQLYRE